MKDSKNLQKVTLDDFNIAALRQAAREGRLFIQPAQVSEQQEREEGIRLILQYVSQIDDCASAPYRQCIGRLWQDIMASSLADLFFFSRYSSSRGKPNWYRVTAFVCLLRESNVYRKDEFSAVDLHLRLEHTTRRNNRYNGMSRYLLEHKDIVVLKRLLLAIPTK